MTHLDISDEHDVAEGERAFRTAANVTAFVGVITADHPLPGCYAFKVTARAVDGDMNPLLDHHGRPLVAGPHPVSVQVDKDEDIGQVLDAARTLLLDRLDRSVSNSRLIVSLPGIKIQTVH